MHRTTRTARRTRLALLSLLLPALLVPATASAHDDDHDDVPAVVERAGLIQGVAVDSSGRGIDDLAVQALRFLAETGGEDALRAFAEQRVSFIEARFEATLEANPDLTPAQVLARVFTDEGYAAGVRELPVVNGQRAGEQLCQQH